MTSFGSDLVVVATPFGEAHILLHRGAFTPADPGPRALVVIGHGASGNADAEDVLAVTNALLEAGCVVARTVQPYRVHGRRIPAPVAQLDEAFGLLVGEAVRRLPEASSLLVVGGRSNGARVAARCAAAVGAHGLLALSFPLQPPRRTKATGAAADTKAPPSRAGELAGAGVPTLVLQGERDSFGTPQEVAAAAPGARVHPIRGAGHSPRGGAALTEAAAEAVRWVTGLRGD